MHADELILPMIQIILTDADIEIKDADRIDLFHLIVSVAQMDMFGDRFRHPVKDTFRDNKARVCSVSLLIMISSFAVQRLDVHTVKLIIG